jgi:hypothetical protein
MRKWKDEDLIKELPRCKTKSELIKKLGLSVRPGNYETINLYIKKLDLDCSHLLGRAHGTTIPPNKQDLKDILIKDSTYTNTTQLKKRLVKNGLLINKCYICDLEPLWYSKTLIMILDHINGNHQDNRIKNLRLLCPNCNSQQTTFCRKKKCN